MNLYRLDAPKEKGQLAVAWISVPMVGDFHSFDRFGQLVFGDEKGEVPPPKPVVVEAKDGKSG